MDPVHVPLSIRRGAVGCVVLLLAGCGASGTSPRAGGTSSGSSGPPAAPSSVAPQLPTSARSSSAPAPEPSPRPRAGALQAFHVADLTFVGTDHGWALGTDACRSGSGRCAALARTTDGARSWQPLPTPPGGVLDRELRGARCAAPCLAHVRFATDEIGYLYGNGLYGAGDSAALFMTTDGGQRWTRQPGGADSLESLDGNVIRVVDQGDCPPGCTYRVETTPVGGTDWHDVALPGSPGHGVGVALTRTGHTAAIESYGNAAGGGPAEAVLWTSANDGVSWTNRGEPCPQPGNGREVDSTELASAPDGSLAVLCVPRFRGQPYPLVSTDGGASFHSGNRHVLGAARAGLIAAASARTLFVDSDALYRSVDGGEHWQRVQQNSDHAPLYADWVGFETTAVGRAVQPTASPSADSSDLVWTTTDGGGHWRDAPVG